MRRLAILLILGYSRLVSPFFPACCRFTPTCSSFAIIAIQEHGLAKGSLLSARRILRCNPLCAGGFDPVPKRTGSHG